MSTLDLTKRSGGTRRTAALAAVKYLAEDLVPEGPLSGEALAASRQLGHLLGKFVGGGAEAGDTSEHGKDGIGDDEVAGGVQMGDDSGLIGGKGPVEMGEGLQQQDGFLRLDGADSAEKIGDGSGAGGAAAHTGECGGYEVGQQVWFIRAGLVVSGIVTGFRPWLTDATRHYAEVEIVDELTASVDTEDLFTGEVPALEWELAETHNKVAYLKSRLRELAKATAAKGRGN